MMINLEVELNDIHTTDADIAEHLIAEYYGSIFHLALSMLHDEASAEDVTQKTLIRALNKFHQHDHNASLRAWIYTIGLNECRSELRKQKARERLHAALVALGVQKPRAFSPPELILNDERDQALWDAVNQLKEKHRIPIILRYSHELTTAEIAEILELPHGTIRSRLHYAHKKLHELLASGYLGTGDDQVGDV